MSYRRLKLAGVTAVYHLFSHMTGGLRKLDKVDREKFVEFMGPAAAFAGIQLITYSVMKNHFHILVRVHDRAAKPLTPDEFIARLNSRYNDPWTRLGVSREDWVQDRPQDQRIKERLLLRMNDISRFMQELKQRFTCWYNKQHKRQGTLWARRFGSTLIEDTPSHLRIVAAYIDLNAVRAGYVPDPKDYRFCGYAAALAGDKTIREGLQSVVQRLDWDEAAPEYRKLVFVAGGVAHQRGKDTIPDHLIKQVLAEGGELSLFEILQFNIRHMTHGLALGGKEFLETVFQQHPHLFSKGRKTGARKIRLLPFKTFPIMALRDLQLNVLR